MKFKRMITFDRIIFWLIVTLVLFSSCNNNQEEAFKKRFEKITSVSPEELCNEFVKICNSGDDSSPFTKYSKEQIDRQCATFYKSTSEELNKLIIDILISENQLANKNSTIDQTILLLESGSYEVSNSLKPLIANSFQLLVEYNYKRITLSNELINASAIFK